MAVRTLVVWAATGGLALAGRSVRAASVLSFNPDEPADRVVAVVVASESAGLPVAARSSPAAPRDPAGTSFFDPVAGLESEWITFELAHELYGRDDHAVARSTTQSSNADRYFLPRTEPQVMPVPLSGSIGRPGDPGSTGRTIALPPGVVTGSVGLLLLLGRGLLRRGWQILS